MHISDRQFRIFLGLIILLQATALFGGIMEPDSALYATIAKRMVLSDNWLDLFAKGSDWLDKPHLPFWMAAASFKIFGINAFAYKLPSFLAYLLAIAYTFRLAAEIYGKELARFSTLISATALHVIISNFDVRAEIYLSAFVIAAIFHLYRADVQPHFRHAVFAAFFLALAIITKGIFVLLPVLGGLLLYWACNARFREVFRLKWWFVLLLTLVFISPELYSLYVQFDRHPEKVVFGRQGVSGIRFFFWDSQFGRFFNNGPIKGKGDPAFFLHTTLWAFLPWSVFLYADVVDRLIHFKRNHFGSKKMIVYGSAGLAFLLFSGSRFQLPHYIIILFPFFGMISADYILRLKPGALRIFARIQVMIIILAFIVLGLVTWFYRFDLWVIFGIILVAGFAGAVFTGKNHAPGGLLKSGLLFSGVLCLFLNVFFYPDLVEYQGGKKAGTWLQNHPPAGKIFMYRSDYTHSFEFYAPGIVQWLFSAEEAQKTVKTGDVLFLPAAFLPELQTLLPLRVLKTVKHYHITRLKAQFINRKTRAGTLEDYVLVEVAR